MSIDQFIASGATALTLALVFLYLLITEMVVPRGRLRDQKDLTDRALNGWEKQTEATNRLSDLVDRVLRRVNDRVG